MAIRKTKSETVVTFSRWCQASLGRLVGLLPARLLLSGRGTVIVTFQGANSPSFRLIGVQVDDKIGEAFHEILIMEHTYDRAGLLTGLLPQDFQDVACEIRIQVGHRFVGKKHLGLLEQSSRDRRSLLLAARHLSCPTVNVRCETQIVEDLERLGAVCARKASKGAPPWISAQPSAEHVMKQRSIPDEQKILKDDAQTLAKGWWRVAAALSALEDDLSLRRRHAARQTSQEAGLASSRWPHDCYELPSRNLDIHPAEKPPFLPLQP